MRTYLDFEKPVAELEDKIEELRQLAAKDASMTISDEVARLESKADSLLRQNYTRLTPWQKTQVARHPNRPHCLDYISQLITDFTPFAGDRGFAEDKAIIGGLGRLNDRPIMLIGQEKGADTEGRVRHNFGMARPEGYRKAVRLMDLAEKFKLPVVTLIDTPGAYPGVGAEERGQAEAIARSTDRCLSLQTPLIALIIGEGMSGGAIALAAGNRVIMLEHAIYSVISPEGCSSILWRSADKAKEAASAMKLTAQELLALGVIDTIIPEPIGGAHREPLQTIQQTGIVLEQALAELDGKSASEIITARREKFLAMGRQGLL
ncbi:MAG TPA: acetyl-CoA carboxylase carboxyltransferase subunit alpha [Alphaproteobacteria bacterium]|nr:acetyl-CoA carboxylase carboxyltransferase subunit alpha [Alphaproteobacteria bacterium]